jgi:hypothetical protein
VIDWLVDVSLLYSCVKLVLLRASKRPNAGFCRRGLVVCPASVLTAQRCVTVYSTRKGLGCGWVVAVHAHTSQLTSLVEIVFNQ